MGSHQQASFALDVPSEPSVRPLGRRRVRAATRQRGLTKPSRFQPFFIRPAATTVTGSGYGLADGDGDGETALPLPPAAAVAWSSAFFIRARSLPYREKLPLLRAVCAWV